MKIFPVLSFLSALLGAVVCLPFSAGAGTAPVCVRGRYLMQVSDVDYKRRQAVNDLHKASGKRMKLEEADRQLLVLADTDYAAVPPEAADFEIFDSRHPCARLLRYNRERRRDSRAADSKAPLRDFSCECDTVVRGQVLPDDPSFGACQLWGLHQDDDTDIDAPEAWEQTTGATDVVVAIVDTGIDYTHPDLAANIWVNPGEIAGNGLDDDDNGYIDDVHGYDFVNGDGDPLDDNSHGTHVAGTIGAAGDNGLGVAGVNWNVKMVALKFLSAAGSGYTSHAVSAIHYATALKNRGINVVATNNSWGGGGYSGALSSAIYYARLAGVLFVAAAGNEANDNDSYPSYPASMPSENVIAVAALTRYGDLAYFSNYGATSVDLAAPGASILSTVPGGGYASYSGTSMAAPHVTGAVALLKARHPALSAAEIRSALINSAVPLPSLSGLVASEGFLNLNDALALVASPTATPTATATATATPEESAAPTPGFPGTPTPELTPTAEQPVPAPSPEPTATPTPTATPLPPTPTATATPSATPTAAGYAASGQLRGQWRRGGLSEIVFTVVAQHASGARYQAAVGPATHRYRLNLPAGTYTVSLASSTRVLSTPARYRIVLGARSSSIRNLDFYVQAVRRRSAARGRSRR